MVIPNHRINEIEKLAEFIAKDFSNKNLTLLDDIANDEDISHYFDHYEDAFDGMLLYDTENLNFHIHINIDNGNSQFSKRGRYTFAHELGHFFIEQHRLGLKYGLLEPHASFHNINQKNLMELEADYFASVLLMPKEKFRFVSGGKNFSFDTIFKLSEAFQTSILATLIRFSKIGTHEIFAVISKDNIAKWYLRSDDFPQWSFKFKVGGMLPRTTVASEFFTTPDSKYTAIQELSADDWFYPFVSDSRANKTMYEQCFYSENYSYVISLLWFK